MKMITLKILRSVLTIWIGVSVVFVLLRASGNPGVAILGDDVSLDALRRFDEIYGLDQPLWVQYWRYLWAVLSWDFGISFRDGRAVTTIIVEALPKTFALMGMSFLFAIAVGIPAGIGSALRPNSWFDRLVVSFATAALSVPNFFLGLVLILLLTLKLKLLPAAGSGSWLHVIMPAMTIGTFYAGIFARFTRASMIHALSEPYIAAARARGLRERSVVGRHALPNASIPVITIGGLIAGGLVSGATVTETVFGWPGIGHLLVTAVGNRDLPVVQAIILMLIVSMVLVNALVDASYRLVDPRIGSQER